MEAGLERGFTVAREKSNRKKQRKQSLRKQPPNPPFSPVQFFSCRGGIVTGFGLDSAIRGNKTVDFIDPNATSFFDTASTPTLNREE
jgi:hypothetical protein